MTFQFPGPSLRPQTRRSRAGTARVVLLTTAASLLGCLVAPRATTAAEPATAAAAAMSFQKDVRPLLEASCFKCHGPAKRKGDVDFSTLADDRSALRDRKLWKKSITQVETLEMPPEGEPPLSAAQREQLVAWMKFAVTNVDCDDPADRDPGPALARRLNRTEYNNTLRDLLGVPFDAAEAVGMPDEAVTHGYDNLVNGLMLPPVLMEKYFAAADKALEQLLGPAGPIGSEPTPADKGVPNPAAYAAVFVATPDAGGLPKRDAARRIIEKFSRKAYRRPVRPEEVERLLKLFDLADGKGDRFDNAVRLMLKAVLVSPHFLFRVEQDRASEGSDAIYRVGDHELATRVSYFLWSTMPDEQLSALADAGKLSDPAVLEQQVRRMLAEPRGRALTDNFAAQWLQLRKLATARPSTEFFPTFTPQLRQAMYDETATFFDHLRTEDRSLLDLLDADYAFLNADLARHYGIGGVEGDALRKVALKPDARRGGLLGMGSVLSLTSHTSRTSPTLRGKWILEVIFGTPPPPPPPDAGMLKEDHEKGEEPKSFREQMAQHAANPTCASCHKRIDPLGYGLENFDAIGAWRDTAGGGRPLDNTGQLPTGEKFTGAGELKKLVLARRDDFVHNATEQLLTYALGRDLQYYDECPVREVKSALERDSYRFSTLVVGIVKSFPFQHRKNTDAVSEE